MGKVITPKYRVECRTNVGYITPGAWKGKVSQPRLERWRQEYNRSFQPGEVNGRHYGPGETVMHIVSAKIVRQSDNAVMAETKMPMFEVVLRRKK